MAISTFIPKVWAARLQENLHKSLVFGQLCNRNYEGDITQFGDTVHINNLADITVTAYTPGQELDAPEALSTTGMTMTIDHAVSYNFTLNDVDAAQARADLMEAAMRNAAHKIAEETEGYILKTIEEGAGQTVTAAIPAEADGGVYALILSIKAALDGKNVPRIGRKLIIPAAIENKLLLDSRFITGSAAADARLAEGAVARACGFDIYISADLTDEIVAMTSDAVTFAQQLSKVEAYRIERGFADGVKGLSLCGCKVVMPDCVYIHKTA